jgi:subtilase family serine protease
MFQPWSLAQGQTVLDSLYVSAASVNVSSGYQLDTLRARLANTTTGISYTSFFLGNPDLGQDVSGTPGTLISGSANDGVWEGTLFIEANTPPGTYPVFVQTFDASFNETLLPSGKTVQITGGDTVPPSLAGTVTMSPTSVDVSDSERTVIVDIPLEDNQSGILTADGHFKKGDGSIVASGTAVLSSGDSMSGVWRAAVLIPRNAEGQLTLFVGAEDAALNDVEFPTGLTLQVSGGDTNTPHLSAPLITPSSVNIASAAQDVNISVGISDNQSGVNSASYSFRDSAGSVQYDGTVELTGGDSMNGTWTSTIQIPLSAPSGPYTLLVTTSDNAGNTLDTLFPGALSVSRGPESQTAFGADLRRLSREGMLSTDPPPVLEIYNGVNAGAYPLSDGNGDTVWTTSLPLHTGQTVRYAFGVELDGAVVHELGDSSGGRSLKVASTDPVTLPTVFFDNVPVSGVDQRSNVVVPLVMRQGIPGEAQFRRDTTLTFVSADPGSPLHDELISVRRYAAGSGGAPPPGIVTIAPSLYWRIATAPSPDLVLQQIDFEYGFFGGVTDPASLRILRRAGSGQPWEVMTTDVGIDQRRLSAHVLAPSGEWTIGTVSGSNSLIPEAPSAVTNPSPIDGQPLVERSKVFSWNGSPPARWYDFYLWRTTDSTPSAPTLKNLEETTCGPFDLLPGVQYRWKVVAKNIVGSASSPVWTFTVEDAPDLVVDSVRSSPGVFSSRSLEVRWIVKNRGAGPTGASGWYDRIYLSADSIWDRQDLVLGTFDHVSHLSPGEAYANTQVLEMPGGIFGQYYLIVWTNYKPDLYESNSSNNQRLRPLSITLTPPPDLQIPSLVIPHIAFSGDSIQVQYDEKNFGLNATTAAQWFDGIYLLPETTFNVGSAMTLGEVWRTPGLPSDSSYHVSLRVKLPDTLSGKHYLFVLADITNHVLEYGAENNNCRYDSITIVLSPPPDLVVESASGPPGANSGSKMAVQWTVRNQGAGPTIANFWEDRFFVSKDSVFNPDSAVVVGFASHYPRLQLDSSYSGSVDVTLPDGISGPYYLYAETDWQNRVFESTFESNNITRSAGRVAVTLSPWPDLAVTTVSAPTAASAGDKIRLSFQVNNLGSVGTPPRGWTDSIFISSSPVWDRALAIPLAEARNVTQLGAGALYTQSAQFDLPFSLSGGTYYYYVWSDAGNGIFEYTDTANNIARSSPVSISAYPPVDLAIYDLAAPSSGSSGQPISLHYRVQNIGQGTTLAAEWVDLIYLSADTTLDPGSDLVLSRIPRSGSVAPGGSYTRDLSLTLPNGISGSYFVFASIDSGNRSSDGFLPNNIAKTASPVSVLLSPSPDLQLTSIASPVSGKSGQPVRVRWSVANAGAGIGEGAIWYDAIVLSRSSVPDAGDPVLGAVRRSGPFGSGASYSDSMEVVIPPSVSGSRYLGAVTDSRDALYEHNAEGNNSQVMPIVLTLAPLVDLVVESVSAPESAAVNQDVTVTWSIRNVGVNTSTGWMTEAVYFSADSLWDVDDLMLGQVRREVTIAPGASSMGTVRANLANMLLSDSSGMIVRETPGLAPGKYYVIVRTNIQNNIRESDLSNNTGTSAGLVNVDVPSLQLGVQAAGTISSTQPRYYRIDVPANLDLRVTASSNIGYPSIDLFSSFGAVPTGAGDEYRTVDPLALTRQLFIPTTKAGAYYLLLQSLLSPSSLLTESYTVITETLGFSVTSLRPAVGGSGGYVTGTVRGAGFRPITRVFLSSGSGDVAEAQVLDHVSSVEMRVRWNLTGVPIGTYDVSVRNGATAAGLPGGFSVEPMREQTVDVDDNSPRALLINRKEQYAFSFTNTSNVDIEYLFARIVVPEKTEVEVLSASPGLRVRSLILPDSLRPDTVTVKDYITTTGGIYIPFVGRNLPPGEAYSCAIRVRNTYLQSSYVETGTPFPLAVKGRTMNKQHFLQDQLARIEELRSDVLASPGTHAADLVVRATDPDAFSRYFLEGYVMLDLLDSSDIGPALGARASLVDANKKFSLAAGNGYKGNLKGLSPASGLFECGDLPLFFGCPAAILDCVIELPIPTVISQILCGVGILNSCFGVDLGPFNIVSCLGIASGIVCAEDWLICRKFVSSLDPNEIMGPRGVGDERWVALRQPLQYTIRFENDSTRATAPAQVVSVTQSFDTTVDVRAFRLGRFGFGRYAVDLPGNTASYSGRIDARDSLGVFVDVVAGIDVVSRKAFWTFKSIDPATGEQPYDPLAGFLPVDDSTGRGTGFVTYSIRPNPASRTRDTVRAAAQIVFDANPPLDTPPTVNTVDAKAPLSSVRPIPAVTGTRTFPVSWGGVDDPIGSGLRTFTIYYSKDNAPYVAWLTNVGDTSAVFTATDSSGYRFFSVATDIAGNAEPLKSAPDASTTVLVGVAAEQENLPKAFSVSQNYPNPFNPTTIIRYELPQAAHVVLKIFNMLGQEVSTVVNEERPAGFHAVQWDARAYPSGVYTYRFEATSQSHPRSSFTGVKKMLLIK